jgi:O-antigen ligase
MIRKSYAEDGVKPQKKVVDYLYTIVILISFPAYPLIAAVASYLSFESTSISLVSRTTNVVLCIIIICFNITGNRTSRHSNYLVLLSIFWAMYVARMLVDTTVFSGYLGQSSYYYWIWAIGGSMLPMYALAMKENDMKSMERYFLPMYYVTFLAGIIAVASASGAVASGPQGVIEETGRARLGDALNPISLGHLGVMLFVQSIWAAMFNVSWGRLYKILLLPIGCAVGAYLILVANSRGPMISVTICLLALLISLPYRYKINVFLVLLVGAVSIIPAARYVEDNYNISVFSRIFNMSVSDQAESSSRLDLFASALNEFVEHPWLGSGMEDPLTGSYPHNVTVEALMALGLFGGLLLLSIFLLMMLRSLKILARWPRIGWPALLFVQYVVGAQFSGSLYSSTYMWCAIGMMVSLSEPTRVFARRPWMATPR